MGLQETENEIGQTALVPVEVKTVWARVEPLRGREYLDAQKIRTETTYKITTRYHADVTEDMKIRLNSGQGVVFEIKSILNPYMANKKLEIICVMKGGYNDESV